MKGGMLFRLGRIDEGYIPIDEAMLMANSERLSPGQRNQVGLTFLFAYGNVRQALKMAAMSLSHSDSALGAFYRRPCSRMDKPRANA